MNVQAFDRQEQPVNRRRVATFLLLRRARQSILLG